MESDFLFFFVIMVFSGFRLGRHRLFIGVYGAGILNKEELDVDGFVV